MYRWLFLLLIICSGLAQATIRVEGTSFVDKQGRTVFFRGINMANDGKLPPFRPISTPQYLDPLKNWGINQIRLIFIWEAFEPERGKYDYSYLDYFTNVIRWAKERDIFVIVDFHQDGYSRFVSHGCGEGFPRWTLPPQMHPDTPRNNSECKNWGIITALSLKMHQAWKHFYRDTYGVRTRFIEMVKTVAKRTRTFSNVIGYDLLNEPWGKPKSELAPLYEDVAQAIREHHPDAIIFINPHVLTVPGIFRIGLHKPSFENYAIAAHFYDSGVLMADRWLGIDPGRRLGRFLRNAREWDVPLFIGEYGMSDNVKNGYAFLTAIRDFYNTNQVSHSQWGISTTWNHKDKDGWNTEDLSIVDSDYRLRSNFLIYAGPRRVSGKVLSISNQESSKKNSLMLVWNHDPKLGETEIFIPKALYASKRQYIETIGDLNCHYKIETLRLYCQSAIGGRKEVIINY